jgi:hypothetical protein
MRKLVAAIAVAAALAGGMAAPAIAHTHVGVFIGSGYGWYPPPQVYYAPPVYYAPRPVYWGPPYGFYYGSGPRWHSGWHRGWHGGWRRGYRRW